MDVKSLIAYSSVCHMAIGLFGIFCLNELRMVSLIFLRLGHAFTSSLMFYGVRKMYLIRGSRNFILNRGFNYTSPIFFFFWFLVMSLNSSAPPSLKIFREIFLFGKILNLFTLSPLFIFGGVFLSGLFSIYFFLSGFKKKEKISPSLILNFLRLESFVFFLGTL